MLADIGRPASWRQLAHASHRFVLPAVAGTALTVGTGIAIASHAAPPLVAPIALIVAGATGVLSSIVYARRTGRTHSAGREVSAPGPRLRANYDHPLASAPLYYGEDSAPSLRRPSYGDIPGDSDRPAGEFPSHLRAGDQLWTHWTTSGLDELPVALVGPIAEVPYFAPEPEKFDPFRSQTEEIQVLPTEPPVAAIPSPLGIAVASSVSAGPAPPFGSPGGALDPIMLEALSAYPPHLRTSIAPGFSPPTQPPPRTSAALCVSCRVVPYEGTVWLPCPDCAGPVCGECVLASFDREENGWCSACARGRTPDGRVAAS